MQAMVGDQCGHGLHKELARMYTEDLSTEDLTVAWTTRRDLWPQPVTLWLRQSPGISTSPRHPRALPPHSSGPTSTERLLQAPCGPCS